jgi:hypothetical protein
MFPPFHPVYMTPPFQPMTGFSTFSISLNWLESWTVVMPIALSHQGVEHVDRIVVGNYPVGIVGVATVGAEGQARRPSGVLARRRWPCHCRRYRRRSSHAHPRRRRSRMVLCWGLRWEGPKRGRSTFTSHSCSRVRCGLQ